MDDKWQHCSVALPALDLGLQEIMKIIPSEKKWQKNVVNNLNLTFQILKYDPNVVAGLLVCVKRCFTILSCFVKNCMNLIFRI